MASCENIRKTFGNILLVYGQSHPFIFVFSINIWLVASINFCVFSNYMASCTQFFGAFSQWNENIKETFGNTLLIYGQLHPFISAFSVIIWPIAFIYFCVFSYYMVICTHISLRFQLIFGQLHPFIFRVFSYYMVLCTHISLRFQ